MFKNTIVNLTAIHKHLGIILDSKLNSEELLKLVLVKMNKTIGLL